MLKLTRFLKNYKLQLILGPIFKLIDAIFELIVPLVMIKIIDVGVAGHDISYVLRMGGLLVVLGATGLISALTCQYFASVASMGSGCALRASLYRKIGSLSSAELDKFGAGGLITRLTNDVNQLQQAVAMLIRLVIRAPFLAVGSMFMAFSIDATLSLVFLVALPLVALVLFLIMSRSVPFYKVIQKKLDKVGELARERLAGERVIRAFGKQSDINARFSVASDDLADTGVHVSRLSALLNPLTFAIANLGIVAILWLSGARVSAGTLTTGEVIALVNYMTQVLLALVVVANLVVTFTRANASASRINEVFDTRASVYSAPNATLSPIAG
ncbi:MAG: ABC transporter permease, partial [Clostridia bacterium]